MNSLSLLWRFTRERPAPQTTLRLSENEERCGGSGGLGRGLLIRPEGDSTKLSDFTLLADQGL